MTVKLWPIERVKPYFRNPRVNDSAVDAVAASLKEFGFRQPIVVDADGVIIVGHTRWKAARKLGLAKVPVQVAKDLTAEQIKAYRIADNQTATIAEWDKELLPLELADLKSANFDLGLLGFSEDDLARWLQPVQEGLCDPDEVPAPPDEPPAHRCCRSRPSQAGAGGSMPATRSRRTTSPSTTARSPCCSATATAFQRSWTRYCGSCGSGSELSVVLRFENN